MNKWIVYFFITLICTAYFSKANAQVQDSTLSISDNIADSNFTAVKSIKLSSAIQHENYLGSFLNFQFPQYDVLISRTENNDSIPFADEYRFGFNAFSKYMKLRSNNLQIDTGKSISRLSIILGTKREQLLFLDHKQRIGKNFVAGVSYNSIVSEGFLFHQFGKAKSFAVSFDYFSKNYSLSANYRYHKVEAEENGGIVQEQDLTGLTKSDYGILQLNLANASTKLKSHNAYLNQSLILFSSVKEDSLGSKMSFNLNTSYSAFGHSYEGNADSAFYSDFYFNADTTKDTSSFDEIKNTAFVSYIFLNQHSVKTSVYAGVSRSDIVERLSPNSNSFFNLSPFVSLDAQWNLLKIKSDLRTVKSNSRNNGDRSLSINAARFFNSKFFNSIEIDFLSAVEMSDAITSVYYSNHFIWERNFLPEKINSFDFKVGIFDQQLKLYGKYLSCNNKVYFDSDATPAQLNVSNNLIEGGLVLNTKVRKFNFYSDISYQQSDNAIVRVPDFKIYSRISFKDYFFKKALLAEFGFAGIFSSKYKANAYMPATGQYYLQDIQEIGGMPTVHFFANLEIGPAILFLKVENLSHNLFGSEDYVIPNYPKPPRTFKLGIRWLLRN